MQSADPKQLYQRQLCTTSMQFTQVIAGYLVSATLLQTVLTSSLSSPSEDVKAVASQALGGVAIGNLPAYLPFILQQIQSQVQLLKL